MPMHAVTYGASRDQFMAKHKANHINVAYAPNAGDANLALAVKAAMFREMGIPVNVCGTEHGLRRLRDCFFVFGSGKLCHTVFYGDHLGDGVLHGAQGARQFSFLEGFGNNEVAIAFEIGG